MALKVYMKNLDASNWTDVTSRTVNANFSFRSGFGSLGSEADLTKLTITYKATDLASAAVFHTSVKQIRVYKDDAKVFEGYTEGSASVQSSRRSDLAWVKVSAYPYLNILKTAKNPSEIVVYDAWASNPLQLNKSVLHILWNAMLSNVDSAYKTLIENNYSITIPTIPEFRSIYRLDADSSLYNEFCSIIGEFTQVHWLDGSTVRFSAPYADDDREIKEIGFGDILENPSIKTSPYKTSKNPVVTISNVNERYNQNVYKLDDGSSDYSGIKDIAIGESYPEEGVATIEYSIKDASDTLEFYYAQNPVLTYSAFKHDTDTTSAVLTESDKDIGGTQATIKFTNNTDVMVDISQISIDAERVFVIDKSTVVEAGVDGEREDIESSFINTVDSARDYLGAIVAEQKAGTASITFSSGTVTGVKPNDIIAIGDIPASYIVKYVSTDLVTGITKYECAMFELYEDSAIVKTILGNRGNKGEKGKDGESVRFDYAWSSSPDAIDDDVTIYTWDGTGIMINGVSIGSMEMDEWEKLVSVAPEGKPYLWVKINDGAEFRLTGKTGATGANGNDAEVYTIKSINPINPVRNTHISGSQTITMTADIQNVTGANPKWTINGNLVASGTVATYNLPYSFESKTITFGLYDGSVSESNKKSELVITMMDVSNSPVYDGAVSSVSEIPTSPTDGMTHSFLWTGSSGTYTVNGQSMNLTKAYPVVWNGANWIQQTTITKDNANSLFAMISDAQSITTDTGVWAWFNNLVAKTASIENLFSSAITILDGGSISSNFDETSKRGFRIGSDGILKAFGAKIFGEINATSGTFNGVVNASTFRIGNAEMKFIYGSESYSAYSGKDIGTFSDWDFVLASTSVGYNTNYMGSFFLGMDYGSSSRSTSIVDYMNIDLPSKKISIYNGKGGTVTISYAMLLFKNIVD